MLRLSKARLSLKKYRFAQARAGFSAKSSVSRGVWAGKYADFFRTAPNGIIGLQCLSGALAAASGS